MVATSIATRTDTEIQRDVLDELKWDARVQPNEIGVMHASSRKSFASGPSRRGSRAAVTLPRFSKVNERCLDECGGESRHPLYAELTAKPDAPGKAGDIQWNFEKFLVSPEGNVLARFRPQTSPESDEVIQAIASALTA